MWKCSQIQNAHVHACMECQREMGGGGGHLMGAPTNWKDGLWGQWWAKLPQVLEWQGWTGGCQSSTNLPEMGGGGCGQAKKCHGELGGGGGAPHSVAASPNKGPCGQRWKQGTPTCR